MSCVYCNNNVSSIQQCCSTTSLAFSVTKATSDSLTFSWDEVNTGTAGNTLYELQLRLVSTERDFTQVRRSHHHVIPDVVHHVMLGDKSS